MFETKEDSGLFRPLGPIGGMNASGIVMLSMRVLVKIR